VIASDSNAPKGAWVATFNHLPALSNPGLKCARSKKSISSACCPIFVCSGKVVDKADLFSKTALA